MKVTIKTIAEKSGYGLGTVSRALSQNPANVSEKALQKILEVAKKYNYIKNITAQALVTGKTTDIGVAIPAEFESHYFNDYFIKLLAGITHLATDYGFNVRLILLKPEIDPDLILREMRYRKLSGLIFSSYCGGFFMEKKVYDKLNMPVVFLNQGYEDVGGKCVTLDDEQGGYDGTKYLINLGHKKIAVINGSHKDMNDRYEGYKRALKDSNIKECKEYVMFGNGKEESGYMETMRVLACKSRPTAIFALNDEMAIGAMKAVSKCGLNCPKDVSTLGFDGLEICNFTEPRLTTMTRPVAEMGRIAVEMLVNKTAAVHGNRISVKAIVTERESCIRI